MAKSLFEGNIADVISDNRFLFDHSTAVTPPIYPWGWPLLLSPFVRVWGIDFDRLKLVEVAVFCAWLVLYHGIVRRRAGRIVALALTAVFATSYRLPRLHRPAAHRVPAHARRGRRDLVARPDDGPRPAHRRADP